jgi:hypothetical protein
MVTAKQNKNTGVKVLGLIGLLWVLILVLQMPNQLMQFLSDLGYWTFTIGTWSNLPIIIVAICTGICMIIITYKSFSTVKDE